MAAYLLGAVDDLGEFLIDLFAGGKNLDPESKSSEFSQSTRSSALVNLHNQEDIRLFTGIFVLQLLEQRYLLKRRPIAKSSQLYLEILVLPWDRYKTLFRMSPEIMNRLVNSIEDHEVFLRFTGSNKEVPIYTSYTFENDCFNFPSALSKSPPRIPESYSSCIKSDGRSILPCCKDCRTFDTSRPLFVEGTLRDLTTRGIAS